MALLWLVAVFVAGRVARRSDRQASADVQGLRHKTQAHHVRGAAAGKSGAAAGSADAKWDPYNGAALPFVRVPVASNLAAPLVAPVDHVVAPVDQYTIPIHDQYTVATQLNPNVRYVNPARVRLNQTLSSLPGAYPVPQIYPVRPTVYTPGPVYRAPPVAPRMIGEGSILHPDAKIAQDAVVGRNVTLWNGAVLGTGSSIGDGTTVGFRAVIGNGVKVGVGVNIGSGATIGEGATLGSGCRISPGVTISANSHIPADAVVTTSTSAITHVGRGRHRPAYDPYVQPMDGPVYVHPASYASYVHTMDQDPYVDAPHGTPRYPRRSGYPDRDDVHEALKVASQRVEDATLDLQQVMKESRRARGHVQKAAGGEEAAEAPSEKVEEAAKEEAESVVGALGSDDIEVAKDDMRELQDRVERRMGGESVENPEGPAEEAANAAEEKKEEAENPAEQPGEGSELVEQDRNEIEEGGGEDHLLLAERHAAEVTRKSAERIREEAELGE